MNKYFLRFIQNNICLAILLLGQVSCVEDFEFNVPSDGDGIVVEGYISNQSYDDLLPLPMDTRYFEVSMKYISEVKNVRDEPVLEANIELHTSKGEVYDYAEIGEGKYGLFYSDFKVMDDRDYHLEITLSDGVKITSEVAHMPASQPIGELKIEETTKSVYEHVIDDLLISEKEGIDLKVETAMNDSDTPYYYKWDFYSTYIFTAFLAEENSPYRYCWASSIYYFQDFKLLADVNGGTMTDLFFLETDNSKLNVGFSVLIRQMMMSKGYYQFMNDIQIQGEQSELFAKPPYNLVSNLQSDDIAVYGYFGVVNEDFHRWYFDKDEVSNYGGYKEGCVFDGVPPPYPASCFNCLSFTYDGSYNNQSPSWWDRKYKP